MKREMSLPLKAVGIFLCSTIFSTLSASDHNIYFADPGSGMIYGMADDNIGEPPVIVSGQLSVNAWDTIKLEADKWVIAPQYHREKLVEVDLNTNTLSVINELPEGWTVSCLAPGLETNNVVGLVYHLENQKIQLYQGTKQNNSWNFSLIGPEMDGYAPSRNCVVHQIDANRYLVYFSWSVMMFDTTSPPTYSEILYANDYEGMLVPSRNMNFFAMNGFPNALVFYDYTGTVIHPEEESSYLLPQNDFLLHELFWNENDPILLGSGGSGNQLFVDNPPYSPTETPEIVYSAHSGDGSLDHPVIYEKDISHIVSLHREGTNTWDCYDQHRNGFYQLDIENDSLTRKVAFEFGTGPDLGSVIAMNTADNGLIHALCLKTNKVQIIAVDPSTGNRTLIVDGLPNLFHPEIRANNDGSYSLFMEDYSNNTETLDSDIKIVQLIPGSNPEDYTINTIASFTNEDYSPQDILLTGVDQGTILFPKNQGTYYTFNNGSELTSYEGIPIYARTQTCRIAIPSANTILLYANRPPSLWDYQPLISSMAQTQLTLEGGGELPSELAYPVDLILAPDGLTLYLSCNTTTNVYAIDSSSGVTTLLTPGKPPALSGDLWGEPPANSLKLCCGPYIELPNGNSPPSQVSGWYLF
jgi:hypothetical protein